MNTQSNQRIVRTYSAYPAVIDPAHILTMVDLDLSYGLASTLVEWDDSRQEVAGLAERWDFPTSTSVRFTLRKNLKWSDGQPIKASDFKKAMERAKEKYYGELQSLFDIVAKISSPDDLTIIIETKGNAAESGILRKLTEPMYGLTATTPSGEIDINKSSGPFFVANRTNETLRLAKNQNWFRDAVDLVDIVELRAPPSNKDIVSQFSSDSWANMISTSSLLSESVVGKFKEQSMSFWQRSYDKVFFLAPTKRYLKEFGKESLLSLSGQISKENLLKGLSGYTISDQFFPRGYILFDPDFKQKKVENQKLSFKRPLEVVIPMSVAANFVKDSLSSEIKRITGYTPNIRLVPLNQVNEVKEKGEYDLFAASVGVNDPNFEGAMAFYFAGSSPLIQSGSGDENFLEKVKAVKSIKSDEEKVRSARSTISCATMLGYVQPMFHFSSLAVGKNGVDLSKVSITRESVPYALIRMKR